MTPRTSRPCERARSARRPASSGSQPQRGMPTVTSMSTSGMCACTAAAIVSSESTATVMRAEPLSTTAREPAEVEALVGEQQVVARGRRRPCPPSRARWRSRTRGGPSSASRLASAVDLNAFTCGRSFSPGHRLAIVATFRSNACTSTSSDGVGRSVDLHRRGPYAAPTAPSRLAPRRRRRSGSGITHVAPGHRHEPVGLEAAEDLVDRGAARAAQLGEVVLGQARCPRDPPDPPRTARRGRSAGAPPAGARARRAPRGAGSTAAAPPTRASRSRIRSTSGCWRRSSSK